MKQLSLRARTFDVTAGVNVVVLNEEEARENDIFTYDRVVLKLGDKHTIALVDLSPTLVRPGEIGLFLEVAEQLKVRRDDVLAVTPAEHPSAIEFIKKKMDGGVLSRQEIDTVINELMENRLSEVELASFITSLYIRGLNTDESVALTEAIVNSGETLDLRVHPIADKHSTGGVAGNRTTMLIVPIVAAAGVYIPKTSSRSITSAAGTADTMEVLANVSFSIDEMRRIVLKTKGCIAWGGAMNLAAADDKLIRIRHPLRLDPKGVMVASVLAKKKSVGAEYVVIDIPVGRGAKIESMERANELAREFVTIAGKLGMRTEVFITYGRDPVGEGIGPALECRDVLRALQFKGPRDLTEKSCRLAGALLELAGRVEPGRGYAVAMDMLKNGKAYEKMKEIIEAQGGNPNVRPDDLPIGQYRHEVRAEDDARVHLVDNHNINRLARAAGAPKSKGAGVLLHVESGDRVKKGDLLFEVIAESESKLSFALDLLQKIEPIEFEKVILGKMGEEKIFEWKPTGG